MTWRAYYKDGSYTEDVYADIDRRKLAKFAIKDGIIEVFSVDVPKGKRFVYRARHALRTDGARALTYILALESEDRSDVDLVMLRCLDDGTQIVRQPGYGVDAESAAPELLDHETVT